MATTQANQAIYDRLNGMQQFHPGNVTLLTDWSIEPGDVIQVQSGTDANGDAVFSPMPVYQLDMTWRGAVTAEVQATGNEKRPPLSALRRQNYSYGHGISHAQKTADEAVDEVIYISDFTKTDRGIGMLAQAIGVKIDEDTGLPAKDEHGEYLFDGVNGATLTGTLSVQAGNVIAEVQQARGNSQTLGSALSLKADTATLISAINNASGTIASGKVQVQPGNVLIEAINNGDGTVTISADKVNINGDTVISWLTSRSVDVATLQASSSLTCTGDTTINNVEVTGTLTIPSSGQASYQITADNLVKSLAITPPASGSNDYTLTWTTADGQPHILTFSRAASIQTVSGSWSGSTYQIVADANGTALPLNETLTFTVGTTPSGGASSTTIDRFSSLHKNTLTVKGSSQPSAAYIKQYIIDASGVYTEGETAGWDAAEAKLVIPTSSDNPSAFMSVYYPDKTKSSKQSSVTYSLTDNSGEHKVQLKVGGNVVAEQAYTPGSTITVQDDRSYTMSSNTATIMPTGNYDAMSQVEVDASGRYYAGKASVTLNDPVWNQISGDITSSRTISVASSGRTDTSGAADNQTKSAALYLTKSGLTVSLRHGSTSGTAVAKTTCSDSNLTAANIKNGVSIFGVTGTYSGSGGGYGTFDGFIDGNHSISNNEYVPYTGGTINAATTIYAVIMNNSGTLVKGPSVTVEPPEGSVIQPKSSTITANGTYYATSDGADGWSSVTVNVGGTSYSSSAKLKMYELSGYNMATGDNRVYVKTPTGSYNPVGSNYTRIYVLSSGDRIPDNTTVHW